MRWLDEAEPLYLPGFFPDVRPIPAIRARVHIAQGRLEAAQAWAHAHQIHPDDPASYLAEYEQLTLARLHIAAHRARPDSKPAEDVLALLDRIVAAAQATDRAGSVIEALLVRALAHGARGGIDEALADLGQAVTTGVPAGYRRLFLDEGPAVHELLRALSRRPDLPGRQDAAALLPATARELHASSGMQPRVPGGQEALSGREIEVLRLLATDLSGPDIADRLFMSVNTFRTHTRHIFTKLDVTTRRAAVKRAGDLRLL